MQSFPTLILTSRFSKQALELITLDKEGQTEIVIKKGIFMRSA